MSIHRYILRNGEIREASEACLFPGQVGLLSGWGVFSTLRIVEGALFAWERHWARLSHDAGLLNVPMPEAVQVERDLLRLVEANSVENGTLRLVVVRNGGGIWEGPSSGAAVDTIALTANSKNWPASARLDVQPHGRFAAGEFASAKMLSWAQNLRWAEKAVANGFDEVILLNEHGRVAECTSANIFAAFGSEVFTPPVSDGCLPGVTRDVLLHEVRLPGLIVRERGLRIEELYEAGEVFITSSTRDLLPVSEIAGRALKEGSEIRGLLSAAFRQFVKEDIGRRKGALVP